jgi:hypothetical protein
VDVGIYFSHCICLACFHIPKFYYCLNDASCLLLSFACVYVCVFCFFPLFVPSLYLAFGLLSKHVNKEFN